MDIGYLSENIVKYRKMKDMTQKELADALNITPQAISKWESGASYPDITLMPAIARVLGVSIDKLFGGEAAVFEFPRETSGMPFIASYGNVACYSDKEVVKVEDSVIHFADNSTADLRAKTCVNAGAGEIRFSDEEYRESEVKSGSRSYEKSFPALNNLKLSLSVACNAEIIHDSDNGCRVKAVGDPYFISSIQAQRIGDTLDINVKLHEGIKSSSSKNNRLMVYMPYEKCGGLAVSIAGSSDVISRVDFNKTVLKISGSGDIKCADTGDLCVSIAGSGDVSCERAEGCTIAIAGSGNVDVKEVSEYINAKISGSGDIMAVGSVDSLKIKIVGSGDFDGKNLTAREAEIVSMGSGDIEVGRIIEKSSEKIMKGTTLKVHKRG